MAASESMKSLLMLLTETLENQSNLDDNPETLWNNLFISCMKGITNNVGWFLQKSDNVLILKKLLSTIKNNSYAWSIAPGEKLNFLNSILNHCQKVEDLQIFQAALDCCLQLADLEVQQMSDTMGLPLNNRLFEYLLFNLVDVTQVQSELPVLHDFFQQRTIMSTEDFSFLSSLAEWMKISRCVFSKIDVVSVRILEEWFVACTSLQNETLLRKIYGHCFATYLEVKHTNLETLVQKLWESILSLSDVKFQIEICSSLSTALFLSNYMKPILEDVRFWQLLRLSMVSPDAPSRKRGIFLLKKSIDFHYNFPDKNDEENTESVSQIFMNYFLLVDALEENQVHIIKPILGKFEIILKKCLEEQFDVAWLLCCLERCFIHESSYVLTWGVNTLLELSPQAIILILEQTDFLSSVLINVLNNPSLFSREVSDLTSLSSTAHNLINFMEKIFACLSINKRKSFFESFINTVFEISWDPVSLYYVTYSLVVLPKCAILSPSTVSLLCILVRDKLYNQDVTLRIATSYNILEICVNWTDTYSMDWELVPTVLGCSDGPHCLFKIPSIRKFVGFWLKEIKTFEGNPHSDLVYKLQKDVLDVSSTESRLDYDVKPVASFVRLIGLFIECNVRDNIALEVILEPFVNCLTNLTLRSYAPTNKVISSIAVYLGLLKELSFSLSENKSAFNEIETLFGDSISQIFRYLLSLMKGDFGKKEFDLSVCILNRIEDLCGIECVLKNIQTNEDLLMGFLYDRCKAHDLQYYETIIICKLMAFVCSVLKVSTLDEELFSVMTKYIPLQLDSINSGLLQHVGDTSGMSSLYMESVVKCCSWLATHKLEAETSQLSPSFYINHILPLFDISGKQSIVHLLDCFLAITRDLSSEEEMTCLDASLEVIWRTLFEYRKSDAFKTMIGQFFRIIFSNSHILESAEYLPMVQKYWGKLVNLSAKVNGVMVSVTHQVTFVFDQADITTIPWASTILQDLLVYGPLRKKDYRIVLQTIDFIRTKELDWSTVIGATKIPESDNHPRIQAINFISEFDVTKPCYVKLADSIVEKLMEKTILLNKEKTIFHNNSLHHRLHQRILQGLLILEPLISPDLRQKLLEFAVSLLIASNSQPSIRYLREWLCIRLIWRSSDSIGIIRKCFERSLKIRFGSLPSFISIGFHIGNMLETGSGAEEAMKNLLKMILPYCFARHFNTRLYAQVAGEKLWQKSKQHKFKKVIDLYQSLFDCMDLDLIPDNLGRSIPILAEDFYFSRFHALNNYSLETIFYDLPRLSNMAYDELIPASKFEVKENRYITKVCDRKFSLNDFASPKWVLKHKGTPAQSTDADTLFQTKLTPWKSMSLEENIDYDIVRRPRSNLIVVASLIDRPPNLGGICRTCEIFGVTEYVLGSLQYIEAQQFQNLSVSAERWLPIKEVKPEYLKQYLMEMEKEGYVLIAAEQTSNSTSLEKFKFPDKSLILLGNEKEGIPTDLLQHVHHCVVIPQYGVIRSLNVHVSAALLVWQYTLQNQPKVSIKD